MRLKFPSVRQAPTLQEFRQNVMLTEGFLLLIVFLFVFSHPLAICTSFVYNKTKKQEDEMNTDNKKTVLRTMDFSESKNDTSAEMTDDEKIDMAAAQILKLYRPAFEELAK